MAKGMEKLAASRKGSSSEGEEQRLELSSKDPRSGEARRATGQSAAAALPSQRMTMRRLSAMQPTEEALREESDRQGVLLGCSHLTRLIDARLGTTPSLDRWDLELCEHQVRSDAGPRTRSPFSSPLLSAPHPRVIHCAPVRRLSSTAVPRNAPESRKQPSSRRVPREPSNSRRRVPRARMARLSKTRAVASGTTSLLRRHAAS